MAEPPRNPKDPAYWTPARRELARELWTTELRAREALRRLAKPQGCYSKEYWTAEKRAAHSLRMRRAQAGGSVLAELEDAFRQVDAAKERMRKLGGLP